LPTAVVDTNNAAEIQHQYSITNSYMDDIDKQQHKLNELSKRYYNLKILYLTTFIVLVLIILLSLLTIKAYRKRNFTMHQMEETNKLLQIKNQFIENQSEELYVQKEELANSNTTKDKLISILAHDLRNPFHTIIGFSDLIINDFNQITDEELKEYIELINSSSKKANELLDNILQWSRLQMGRIEMIAQEVFVIDLIKDVLSFSESEIFRKKIDLVLLVSPQIKVRPTLI
jgi:signal transduction histidine kinase